MPFDLGRSQEPSSTDWYRHLSKESDADASNDRGGMQNIITHNASDTSVKEKENNKILVLYLSLTFFL